MKTTGNTIFLPGGTSGIGLGLAQRLHADGNRVIVAGRRVELLEQITRDHPGMASVAVDMSDPTSITAAFDEVTERFPELNVVITMAGIMAAEDLTDPAHLATAESIVTTNLLGPIRLLAQMIPFLLHAKDPVIMNVSSGLAFVPLPATPTYNATKAAIHSYTESLRVQLAATPIQVLELVPPAVQTDLFGMAESEHAMPLVDYLDEVMAILRDQPDAREILVKNVEFLRFAEAHGEYDEALAAFSAMR